MLKKIFQLYSALHGFCFSDNELELIPQLMKKFRRRREN